MKKTLNILLRLAIVAGCLLYAFWDLEWKVFFASLKQYGAIPVIGVLCCSFAQYIPTAWRLNYLTGYKAGFFNSFKANIFCLGLNNIFPAKLGEVAKAFYLRRKVDMPMGQALGLVFWERFFDLNCLLLIGLCSAVFMPRNLAILGLGVVVGGLWVCLILFRFFPSLPGMVAQLIPGQRFKHLFKDIIEQLQGKAEPRFFLALSLYSAVVWVTFASITLLALYWMGGFDLTLPQALIVFVVASLGFAVPASPGGVGVYEAAITYSLGLFGVGKEEALALALVLHMIIFVPPILGAMAVLTESGLSLSTLRHRTMDPCEPGESTEECLTPEAMSSEGEAPEAGADG